VMLSRPHAKEQRAGNALRADHFRHSVTHDKTADPLLAVAIVRIRMFAVV
jgi:hypothetical protein